MNKFPGTPLENQRDVAEMRPRLELQFLRDGTIQNWMFQVEDNYVSHQIEEVSETPLRNQSRLLRLVQGRQPTWGRNIWEAPEQTPVLWKYLQQSLCWEQRRGLGRG